MQYDICPINDFGSTSKDEADSRMLQWSMSPTNAGKEEIQHMEQDDFYGKRFHIECFASCYYEYDPEVS